MKKKNSKLSGFYLGLIFVLMYLPIAVVIVFSFNESKLPVRFTGFSLKWYQELIHDDAMLEALGNSLFLGVVSCSSFIFILCFLFFKKFLNALNCYQHTKDQK